MMAPHAGGRPASSRRVRLVPVRRSGLDHRAVARIVLALARQMATDEAVESVGVDEVVSSSSRACPRRESGPSVGRCAANEPVSASPGSGLAGRCAHQRHEGAHYSVHESATAGCSRFSSSDEVASASSVPGGAP